jgi:minor extracellular serine protease Vpr
MLAAALAGALTVVSTAAAGFQPGLRPIRRTFGEITVPRLRVGTLKVPAGHRSGRVRVVVRLGLAPLARTAAGFDSVSASRRLDVTSAASRAYLARLARAQAAAVAQLRRTIPQARVQERYGVVFDGFAVSLPAKKLPALVRQPFAVHVYPSVRFTLNTNRSPAVIGADQVWAETGARGDGIKIGVVDDGVDFTNPYFDPRAFSYPAGFPKGQTKYTTPKVIAARAFAAPGAGKQATLPLYRAASFHGTHVAGIAAGDAGTTAPAGPDHPAIAGLSGVAPRAWVGNYRVFSRPTPGGFDAFTPEIVAAFESAVRDGMNVINFSGGGPAIDPANDALLEAVDNTAAAGVVPVISAGNDRDEFGLGSVGTPGTAPDAISVAAVSNSHWFGPALTVTAASAPPELKQVPFAGAGGEPAPNSWGQSDQTLADVGVVVGRDGKPVERHLCGPGDPNNPSSTNLPAGSLNGSIALVFRGSCTFDSKARRAQAAGAIGIIYVNNRAGETDPIPVTLTIPAGMVSDLDGARLRDYLDSVGGRAPIRVGRDAQEINTGRSGIVTSFSSAGPDAFTHSLKPDVAAPGGQILSSTLPEFAHEQFAVFDGTSMAAPHVTGAAALLKQLHPDWTPLQVKSALVSTAGAAWADTARTTEAQVELEGAGLINVSRARDPNLFTDSVST